MRDESHLFHSCNCCWWKRLILLPHLNMDSRKKSAPSASWVKTLNHPGFFCEDPLSMGFLLARYLVGFRAASGTGEERKVTSPQCIFCWVVFLPTCRWQEMGVYYIRNRAPENQLFGLTGEWGGCEQSFWNLHLTANRCFSSTAVPDLLVPPGHVVPWSFRPFSGCQGTEPVPCSPNKVSSLCSTKFILRVHGRNIWRDHLWCLLVPKLSISASSEPAEVGFICRRCLWACLPLSKLFRSPLCLTDSL